MKLGRPGAAVAEVRDGVAWIKLDRPERRNALNLEVWEALGEIGEALTGDTSVRVGILHGEGKSFCSGLDLAALSTPGILSPARKGPVEAEAGGEISAADSIARLQRCFRWLGDAPFPTVAAVHGHALGAGWQLALWCDFVIAAAGTRFAMLETNYGLVPDMGGTARLVRSAGIATAKYLVLTGRSVGAEQLLSFGLVAEVVEEAELLDRAAELAEELKARSPTALRAAKKLVEGAWVAGLEEALEAEAWAQQECMTSADFVEAVSAFLQKRPPRFGC